MNFESGEDQSLRRVAVVGTSGSGKTSLALTLARKLRLKHVELDALFWEAGWQKTPRDVFHARVVAALAVPGWVTEGNYHIVRDVIWRRATTLVWLDYPLALILWRLARRTLGAWRGVICSGTATASA